MSVMLGFMVCFVLPIHGQRLIITLMISVVFMTDMGSIVIGQQEEKEVIDMRGVPTKCNRGGNEF